MNLMEVLGGSISVCPVSKQGKVIDITILLSLIAHLWAINLIIKALAVPEKDPLLTNVQL